MATDTLQKLLKSVRLPEEVKAPRPMIAAHMDDVMEDVTPEERFISSMAALVLNLDSGEAKFDKQNIQALVSSIDEMVQGQLNEILHAPSFQNMEATWSSIAELVANTNFKAQIDLNLLDVSKEEALEDLELNIADIGGSELFKKVYVAEYDQFGGSPYGAIIGLYEFENKPSDIVWLRGMGKVAS
ncbi:MAG TPA: type VI secretion system contractile sheath large subunit, partial [Polyangiaceae bacterium]|nr:type VI secretion system contractile sheath large subunit [Polyangiaceae bacterium]